MYNPHNLPTIYWCSRLNMGRFNVPAKLVTGKINFPASTDYTRVIGKA
jgi:hypothetical protein